MSKPRIRAGLLGLGLIGLAALPAAAQSWPSDSGPTGDYLGSSLRQFDRLSPPPIESLGRGERPVPDMAVTDLPGSTAYASPAPAKPRRAARAAPRRVASPAAPRRPQAAVASQPRQDREAELARELADRDRRIRELESQIGAERGRFAEPARGNGPYRDYNPAGAPTVTPR